MAWFTEPSGFTSRADAISHADVVSAVSLLLEQNDIADLAIEDLRKWGCWDMTDKVLSFEGHASHKAPIVRRAILRFALSAADQNQAKAVEFVKEMRAKDAEWVKDVEEILKLETPAPAASASKK